MRSGYDRIFFFSIRSLLYSFAVVTRNNSEQCSRPVLSFPLAILELLLAAVYYSEFRGNGTCYICVPVLLSFDVLLNGSCTSSFFNCADTPALSLRKYWRRVLTFVYLMNTLSCTCANYADSMCS